MRVCPSLDLSPQKLVEQLQEAGVEAAVSTVLPKDFLVAMGLQHLIRQGFLQRGSCQVALPPLKGRGFGFIMQCFIERHFTQGIFSFTIEVVLQQYVHPSVYPKYLDEVKTKAHAVHFSCAADILQAYRVRHPETARKECVYCTPLGTSCTAQAVAGVRYQVHKDCTVRVVHGTLRPT